jgi:PiT family inorganic phosphate transporter
MTATLDTNPSQPDRTVAVSVRKLPSAGELARNWRVGGGIVAAALVLLAAALSGHGAGHDLILPAGIVLMVALAYANGSNDVSKAIATLAGSGVTNYRRAIAWGTICTVAGSLCSALIAKTLIGTFTKGFIVKGVAQTEIFALAVLVGAILWVLLATRISMPVSTTHAITGSLIFVGAFVFGTQNVQWHSLLSKVVVPLIASPFIALALALVAYLVINATLARLSGGAMNGLHWLSSGVASFARGLNDTPKIVALGVAFYLISSGNPKYQTPFWLFALVALGMGLGSFISGLKVTKTLAEKVTKMDNTEGFSANIVTAFLVATASNLGLPVSTTHVSSGAIIGIGLRRGVMSVRWKVVRDMALAWIVTLPAAGVLGIIAYLALRAVHGGM